MAKRLIFILVLVFSIALAMQLAIGVAIGDIEPTLGAILAYGLYMSVIGLLGFAIVATLPVIVLLLVVAKKRDSNRIPPNRE